MKSFFFKTAILLALSITALLRAEVLNSYDFESGTSDWTIKGNESGFMHGSASALVYVGNGGNTTNTLYIQDLNLAGGARDIAYSPQLNLAAHTGKAIKLSFDYLFQTFAEPGSEDTLRLVYRTSTTDSWHSLVEKLPISDMLFVNYYLFLPQDLFVNGLQLGFSYQPAMGVGAAVDNVKLELFNDMNPPQLVYTTGLVSGPEAIHLSLTVTDDSVLPATAEGSCTINGQSVPFTMNYQLFGTEKKYKTTITPATPFIGEIPCSVILKDEYNNSDTVEFTVKTMNGLNNITESFEGFTDFSNTIPNWTVINKNRGQVWQLGDYNYPNTGSIPGFFVFNHQATTPAMPDSSFSYTGIKSLICMSSMSPPNDNWIVTPYLDYQGTDNAQLSFWARSIQAVYGLDRFKVYYSTTGCDPSDFVLLAPQGSDYIEAPLEWTQFSYTLPQKKGYLAIQSVSHDNFGMLVDDLYFGTGTQIETETTVQNLTLLGNYPNPFNPQTTISFNLPHQGIVNLTVYNAKGEQVTQLLNKECTAGLQKVSFNAAGLNSGLYFYRISAAGQNLSGKMLLVK